MFWHIKILKTAINTRDCKYINVKKRKHARKKTNRENWGCESLASVGALLVWPAARGKRILSRSEVLGLYGLQPPARVSRLEAISHNPTCTPSSCEGKVSLVYCTVERIITGTGVQWLHSWSGTSAPASFPVPSFYWVVELLRSLDVQTKKQFNVSCCCYKKSCKILMTFRS